MAQKTGIKLPQEPIVSLGDQMKILGSIHDITIERGKEGKLKVRIVDENNIISDKVELIFTKDGKIVIQ